MSDNDDDGYMDELPSPDTARAAERFPVEESDKGGVSALTMTLNQMHVEETAQQVNAAEELRRDVEMKWATIHTHHDIPAHMVVPCPISDTQP